MSGWSSPGRLVGAALPMVAWALHFVTVYGVVGVACGRASAGEGPGLVVALLLLTALALAAVAWQGLRGWRLRRREREAGTGPQRRGFMAGVTVLVAIIAFVSVLLTATPILLLPPCA